jgi:hypothetical protein
VEAVAMNKDKLKMTESDYLAFIELEKRARNGVVSQRLGTEAEFFSLLRVAIRQRDILHELIKQDEQRHFEATDIHAA